MEKYFAARTNQEREGLKIAAIKSAMSACAKSGVHLTEENARRRWGAHLTNYKRWTVPSVVAGRNLPEIATDTAWQTIQAGQADQRNALGPLSAKLTDLQPGKRDWPPPEVIDSDSTFVASEQTAANNAASSEQTESRIPICLREEGIIHVGLDSTALQIIRDWSEIFQYDGDVADFLVDAASDFFERRRVSGCEITKIDQSTGKPTTYSALVVGNKQYILREVPTRHRRA